MRSSVPRTAYFETSRLLRMVSKSSKPKCQRQRTGAGTSLLILFLFEESPQIDATDGGSGSVKAVAQLNLLAHLLDQLGRNVEGFRFPLDEHGNLKLRMQVLAVGAMTVGPATSPLAFDEGAGQHLAQSTKAADEPAAQCKFRVAGHFYT